MNTLLLVLAAGIANPSPSPLRCDKPIAAKGDIKSGPALSHTFDLVHGGGVGTLNITRIEAGCGCMRQTLTANALQPGETARLTIEVNTLTQPVGPNRWQIVVGYKHEVPGTPAVSGELLLQITAALSREVNVTPPQVAFSTIGAASQRIVVTDTRANPLTVLRAGASCSHLTVEVGAREEGKGQTVTIHLAADMPAGHRDEVVLLVTDDPAYGELRVPVRVLKRAAGSVVATPETVSVRLAPDQREVSTLVQLRASDGKPIGIAAAESDHPGVTLKWGTGQGTTAVVRITVTDVAASQSGTCRVRIKLTEVDAAQVVIPVSWTSPKK